MKNFSPKRYFAYCWASGQIEFGKTLPPGSLVLFSVDDTPHNRAVLKEKVQATARHSRTNDGIFVSGVPEAADDLEGYAAVEKYIDWVKPSLMREIEHVAQEE